MAPPPAVFLIPLLLYVPLVSSADAGAEPIAALLDRQESQLRRLETIVESLQKSVAALQSSLSGCPSAPLDRSASSSALPTELEKGIAPPDAEGGDRTSGVSVTKHKTSWSERFVFAAAARLDASAFVAALLPYEDVDGNSKYFAVGDTRGRIYVFSSAGDVLIELPSLFDSPVTSMLSYFSFRRNETLLFAGHGDGSISVHRLYESAASGDDWLTLSVGSSKPFTRGSRDFDAPPVSGLEVHQVGRIRYILAWDGGGRIRVFTENGTLFGTAITSSPPLAFMNQRLLFLTETGAGSLDLRSMVVRETECEGLNGAVAKGYSFDSSERLKAYGFTAGGDLIHVVLLGDVANLKCRLRSVRKAEIDRPLAIQSVKGYLLVANYDKVFMYNISSQFYGRVGAPRPMFSVTIQEIKSQFVESKAIADGSSDEKPFIAVDHAKLVVLGLGSGYIGVYRLNVPTIRVDNNAVVWSAPALLFLFFLIGAWQFYVKKKDSLGWTPEESFNAIGASSSSHLGSGASDRSSVDDARAGDIRELRGGALRGPPRRYASPPRYPGGSGIPFRSGTVDPGFGGPGELKFRGQSVEPPEFVKRREALYQNSQDSDDHID